MVATLVHFVYGFLGWEVLGRQVPLWAALLLCQLPDLDFGIGLFKKNIYIHRRYFHNIFVFAAMLAVSSYFFGFLPSFILIGAHLFLDLFDCSGFPLLYPLKEKKYRIYKLGHVKGLPRKLVWDGTWWFYGIAVFGYLVFLLVK